MNRLFTSESVTNGHPDKVADQISDGILDAYLREDPFSRVACETLVTTNLVVVSGEITSKAEVDVEKVCRDVIRRIGCNDDTFSPESVKVQIALHRQSPDIAMGVDKSCDSGMLGAGDQGIMFGYAINDGNEDYMPLPMWLARKLTDRLQYVREEGILPYIKADGKSQVTIEDLEDGKRIDCIIISTQHEDHVGLAQLRKDVMDNVIKAVPEVAELLDDETYILINPTGRFVEGGPSADTGVTGRKLICDTYGGMAHHGGGAFSGKDPTKVDRSAAYALRNIAKTIVKSGVAMECEIQSAYAIGKTRPISLNINTFGTSKLDDATLLSFINANFDLSPQAIIDRFGLRRPIYLKTASNGHFGNEEFPWEQCDDALMDELRSLAGLPKREA